MGRRFQHGFTLIELLVVISVIAAVMGILMPALQAATAAARQSQCGSNLRQFGIFSQVYAADFAGYMFPSDFDPSTRYLAWQIYAQQSYDWGKEEMFQCPAIPAHGQYNPSGMTTSGAPDFEDVSYTMNAMRPGEWTAQADSAAYSQIADRDNAKGWTGIDPAGVTTRSSSVPLRMDLVAKSLSNTIVITDHRADYANDMKHGSVTQAFTDGVYRFGESDHSTNRTARLGVPRMKVGTQTHGGDSFNLVFGDGHVETLKETDPTDWVVVVGY